MRNIQKNRIVALILLLLIQFGCRNIIDSLTNDNPPNGNTGQGPSYNSSPLLNVYKGWAVELVYESF